MKHSARSFLSLKTAMIVGLLMAGLTHASTAKELKPARLASASGVASPITANILIGKFLGYYEQEGLDFGLATLGARGSVAVLNALATETAHFGTGGPDTIYRAERQGLENLVGFYTYTPGHPQRVAVPADSPIRSIQDLKGKKIGVRGAGFESFTVGILKAADMDPNATELVPVGIGSQPYIALQRDEVDALSLFDIDMKRVETLGAKLRYLELPPAWEGLQGPILYARKDVLEKNREMFIGFGRAVAKGTVFTITNPVAAVRIFYEMYPQAVPKGRSFEEAVKNTTDVLNSRLPQLTLRKNQDGKWGYMDPKAWETEAELMGSKDSLKKPIKEYFTNELIDEINKFDEQAIVEQAKNFDLQEFKKKMSR